MLDSTPGVVALSLPLVNLLSSRMRFPADDLGDAIDYGQRFRRSMGDLVQETLETLELHGGPDAFINLRYCVSLARGQALLLQAPGQESKEALRVWAVDALLASCPQVPTYESVVYTV